MNREIRETFSAEETFLLGEKCGREAEGGQVYALTGDLGAGKTLFAQGFARGLGIADYVNSPTFTILQIYGGGRLPLYHFDVYRIEDPSEMYETGFEDYFYGDGVCLIEWAGLIEELLPADCIRVTFMKDPEKGDNYRKIILG